MLLVCVRTNYIQSLGRVDQSLREDSEVFIRGQEEHRRNGKYAYNG